MNVRQGPQCLYECECDYVMRLESKSIQLYKHQSFMYNSWIFYHVKYLNILTLKQGSIKEINGSCCGLDMEPRKELFMVIYK